MSNRFAVGDTFTVPGRGTYRFKGGDDKDKKNWTRVRDIKTLASGAAEFAQGLTFNLADEIGLGATALLNKATHGGSLPEIYADLQNRYQQTQAQYRKDFPWESFLSQVGGSLATGGLGGAKLATSLAGHGLKAGAKRAGATIGTGAAGGAVSGYGQSTGDLEENLRAAGEGAAWGAGLGAAAATALPVIRAGGRLLSPRKRAEAAVRRALPEDVKVTHPEQTLAEAGGEAGEFLAQGVVSLPGKSRDRARAILDSRQRMQHQRVSNIIEDIQSKHPDEYLDELDTLYRTRGDVAREQYGNAFRGTAIDNSAPILQKLIKEQPGDVAKAWRIAQTRAGTNPHRTPLPEIFRFKTNKEGKVVGIDVEKVPDLEAWHHIQMGLKDASLIKAETLPTGKVKMTGLGSDYHILRKELQRELYKQSPDYERATKSYATYSEQLDAAKAGRSFFNKKPDEVSRYLDGLPQPAQEAYVMGVARGMQDLADRADESHDAARRVLKSKAVRKSIERIMGPEAGKKLMNSLEVESGFSKARQRILENSSTAQRIAAQQGLSPSSGIPVLSMASDIADRALLYQPKRNQIGEILLRQGPAAQATWEALQRGSPSFANPFTGLQAGYYGGEIANRPGY